MIEEAKMTLFELADQCEAATDADRELDVHIAVAVEWRWPGYEPDESNVNQMVERHGIEWLISRATRGFNSCWTGIPQYTGSLDAAMRLVPDECMANIMMAKGRESAAQVHHFLPGCMIPHKQSIGGGATPALALAAAALRAINLDNHTH